MGNACCGGFQQRGYAMQDRSFVSLLASFLKMFIMLNYLFLVYYIFSILYCLIKRFMCSQCRADGKCCKGFSDVSTVVTGGGSYNTNGSQSTSYDTSGYQSTSNTESIGQSAVSADSPGNSCETVESLPPSSAPHHTLACQSTSESFSAVPSQRTSECVQVPCMRLSRDVGPRPELNLGCKEPTKVRAPMYNCKNIWRSLFMSSCADRVRAKFHEWMTVPRVLPNCPAPNEYNSTPSDQPQNCVSEYPQDTRCYTPSQSYASSYDRQRERSRSTRRCKMPAECGRARRDCSERRDSSRPRDFSQSRSVRNCSHPRSKSRCRSTSSFEKIRVEFKVKKNAKGMPKCRPLQEPDCRSVRGNHLEPVMASEPIRINYRPTQNNCGPQPMAVREAIRGRLKRC